MILKTKITDERKAWNSALQNWNGPSIPYIIIPKSKEELEQLGEVGTALREELAFMNIENFQTYANLENIIEAFPENPQRGLEAVTEHEVGNYKASSITNSSKHLATRYKDISLDVSMFAYVFQ